MDRGTSEWKSESPHVKKNRIASLSADTHTAGKVRTGLCQVLLLMLSLVGVHGRLLSHPFLNNTWQVLVESNRLAMRVTATLREVSVIQGLRAERLIDLPTLQNAACGADITRAPNCLNTEAQHDVGRVERKDLIFLHQQNRTRHSAPNSSAHM